LGLEATLYYYSKVTVDVIEAVYFYSQDGLCATISIECVADAF
jgi:hypothetical protein